jgi:hypothetical protein
MSDHASAEGCNVLPANRPGSNDRNRRWRVGAVLAFYCDIFTFCHRHPA